MADKNYYMGEYQYGDSMKSVEEYETAVVGNVNFACDHTWPYPYDHILDKKGWPPFSPPTDVEQILKDWEASKQEQKKEVEYIHYFLPDNGSKYEFKLPGFKESEIEITVDPTHSHFEVSAKHSTKIPVEKCSRKSEHAEFYSHKKFKISFDPGYEQEITSVTLENGILTVVVENKKKKSKPLVYKPGYIKQNGK